MIGAQRHESRQAPAASGEGRERLLVLRGAAALVVLLTAIGIPLRLIVAGQSVFGDELSTYWIVTRHSLHGVLSLLYSTASIHHAEITPPLYFVASWLTTRLGDSAELLRTPSLLAGVAMIPAVYLLGLRTVGRRAALVATALTTLAPFTIYYSTEARAYGVLMLLVVCGALAMLLALDTRRTRWWVAYAVCSCAALYTHYTCAFVLAVQILWSWWAHPEARRPLLLANLGAALGLVPWIPGLINDYTSPTVQILSALSPWGLRFVPGILAHWAIGYPYVGYLGLSQLPGTLALVLLGLAVAATLVGLADRLRREPPRSWRARIGRRTVLVLALAAATPVGEALVSTVSTHIFGVRNLAASWPAAVLCFALLLTVGRPLIRIVAVGLAVAAFGIAADRMLVPAYGRPDYQAAAEFIDQSSRARDVVIDETGEVSPGPLTSLDVALHQPRRVLRAGAPAEHNHPFGFADPIVPLSEAVSEAVSAARGAPIILVSAVTPRSAAIPSRVQPANPTLPPAYRLASSRVYAGVLPILVRVYAERA